MPKTGTIHYHSQLRFPDKGRAIKSLLSVRVLLYPISREFENKRLFLVVGHDVKVPWTAGI